ncbi:TnsD family Tn7-like transposition protein [Brassicibacter mesophilus]|uniref:TnsD family Tn7-like transposition protein n=1 Tax=Brassicibacter mesophilus TaxID=745119 RepID=UPI003D202242
MLTFFTDPYKDELLYGAIGRYHYYVGNIDYKDTLREIFENESVIPSLELCGYLDGVSKNLGEKYTPDYIINNHTIFPFYAPFMPICRRKELINDMKNKDGKGLYTKIGMVAGSVCKKEGIYYCPMCSKNEIKKYGEAYIHREHQLQGVFLCPNNGVKLKRYKIDRANLSRLEFIRLNEKLLDLNVEYENNEDIYRKLLKISETAYYILNNNLYHLNKDILAKKYKENLYSKGLLSVNKRVKQQELYEEFIKFYGITFLEVMESSIDKNDEYNWLKVITRNSKRTVHPIRHILLINFLVEDIEEFFRSEEIDKYNLFGKPPWTCLNPVAEHYKKDVVESLVITADYKTRLPVGTFLCNCGFTYSRKGPDKDIKDRYKVGRVKKFGHVWEDTLKGYLQQGNYSLKKLAKIMQCDPKTIIKFDKKLNINYFDTSIIRIEKPNIKKQNNNIDIQDYKENILNIINKYPNYSRTQIRELCKKEYSYLYKHDGNWLFKNLPQGIDRKNIDYKSNKRVDWEKRDVEVLESIKQQYKGLLLREKPVRVTKGNLCKGVGILPIVEKQLDKLPGTKEYLDSILESVEEFQLRRSKLIIEKKVEAKERLRLWEVQRLAGIKTEDFSKIRTNLEEYIDRGYKH